MPESNLMATRLRNILFACFFSVTAIGFVEMLFAQPFSLPSGKYSDETFTIQLKSPNTIILLDNENKPIGESTIRITGQVRNEFWIEETKPMIWIGANKVVLIFTPGKMTSLSILESSTREKEWSLKK